MNPVKTLVLSAENPISFHVFFECDKLSNYEHVIVKNTVLVDERLNQLSVIPSWHLENVQIHVKSDPSPLLRQLKNVKLVNCSFSGYHIERGQSFGHCRELSLINTKGSFILSESLAQTESLWIENMTFSEKEHRIEAISGPRRLLELTNCTASNLHGLAPNTLVIRVTSKPQTYKLGPLAGVRHLVLITTKCITQKKLRIEDLGDQVDLQFLTIIGDVEFGLQYTDPSESIKKLNRLVHLELMNLYLPRLCIHSLLFLEHVSLFNTQIHTINNLPSLVRLKLCHCSRVGVLGITSSDLKKLVCFDMDSESSVSENRIKVEKKA